MDTPPVVMEQKTQSTLLKMSGVLCVFYKLRIKPNVWVITDTVESAYMSLHNRGSSYENAHIHMSYLPS